MLICFYQLITAKFSMLKIESAFFEKVVDFTIKTQLDNLRSLLKMLMICVLLDSFYSSVGSMISKCFV